MYWKYLQKRKLSELKMQIRIAGGTLPEDNNDLCSSEKEALERVKNPLKDFPYDIKYLSQSECKSKVEISARFEGKIPKEKIWDKFRGDSCLGKHGIVAKRCSMNDVLWERYVKHGDALTLEEIKRMIRFDVKRRELYPPEYKGVGDEQPPAEYLDKLRKDGKLEAIYNELDTIAKV